MTIDWAHFTPWTALGGGALIGLAAAGLILLLGRIAGICGIAGGLVDGAPAGDRDWRAAFVGGLLLAPAAWWLFGGHWPAVELHAPGGLLVLAGLLVGYGTRLGNGCTSGHGVCGLARLSPRSLAATLTFMATGFLATFMLRHVFGGAP